MFGAHCGRSVSRIGCRSRSSTTSTSPWRTWPRCSVSASPLHEGVSTGRSAVFAPRSRRRWRGEGRRSARRRQGRLRAGGRRRKALVRQAPSPSRDRDDRAAGAELARPRRPGAEGHPGDGSRRRHVGSDHGCSPCVRCATCTVASPPNANTATRSIDLRDSIDHATPIAFANGAHNRLRDCVTSGRGRSSGKRLDALLYARSGGRRQCYCGRVHVRRTSVRQPRRR